MLFSGEIPLRSLYHGRPFGPLRSCSRIPLLSRVFPPTSVPGRRGNQAAGHRCQPRRVDNQRERVLSSLTSNRFAERRAALELTLRHSAANGDNEHVVALPASWASSRKSRWTISRLSNANFRNPITSSKSEGQELPPTGVHLIKSAVSTPQKKAWTCLPTGEK